MEDEEIEGGMFEWGFLKEGGLTKEWKRVAGETREPLELLKQLS